MNSNIYSYNTDLGIMIFKDVNNYITSIYIDNNFKPTQNTFETKLIKYASNQIIEYLKGIRTEFDFPIKLIGTDFQKNVWKALTSVPYGQSRSYKDIGIFINNPKASRAIGTANSKNPILIVVPCHRIINSNGKIGGYSYGIDMKKKLLNLENIDYKK